MREQLSLDTWLVLGSLERVLHELAGRADAAGPGDDPALAPTLARVLEGLLALAGLGAESMVRDLGWYFMDLGRRLERALNLLALLRATLVQPHGAAVGAVVLESVLVTAESVITFRRRHPVAPRTRSGPPAGGPAAGGGSAAQVAGVLDLLLLDRSNPRALAYQLDRAETDLTRISPLDRLGRDATLDRALRAVGARLREADPIALARAGDGRRGPLATLLDTLAGELGDLAVAVEAAHFLHTAPLRPMPIATPGWQA